MTQSPAVFLTIIYWLHMLATVIWIGGQSALAFMVLPAARKTLQGETYAAFIGQLTRRLQTIGWVSLAVLIATGMFQMSSSPFYDGFLAINNPWALAILLKHGVIGLMVLLGAYSTWGLSPALQRTALLISRGKGSAIEQAALQRREQWLVRINLVISLLVLLMTAWARSVA